MWREGSIWAAINACCNLEYSTTVRSMMVGDGKDHVCRGTSL